jgi:hypothetical protein
MATARDNKKTGKKMEKIAENKTTDSTDAGTET